MAKSKGGFLRIPALEAAVVAVLKGINGIVGNYGLAIIIVTIIVRALMFPLTLKQEKSMKKMRELQPQLDKIKEKYKDNPQEFQKRTAEIYKENNVNPLSGCFPILLQMPIFIALFYAFSGDAIPNDATFLWFNLKKPDELFKIGTFTVNLLPILNTAITFFQQKIMSGGTKGQETNSQMQTMMYTMPIMMLLLFYRMPSGVTLYYLVSGALSLVQQYFIMKGRD
ncbi:MAG: YidC/Oxa1 family membrane protein insertase [Leptotrichiaceae bacterium]|nr:YidC/Oxa1 family membrane protein insertase [Leptotrichiaceae bacterium]